MSMGEYQCTKCEHQYEVPHGAFGCPPGYEGESCGANDPALCTANPQCWGCSPCGRSRRKYRCAQCLPPKECPACGHHMVKWLNYKQFTVKA